METPTKTPYLDTTNNEALFRAMSDLAEKLGMNKTAGVKNLENNGAVALCGPPRPFSLDGSALSFWRRHPNAVELSPADFIAEMYHRAGIDCRPKSVVVPLNDEYSATVSANSIIVGCQIFPIDVLDKLNEARTKVAPAKRYVFDGKDTFANLPPDLSGFRRLDDDETAIEGDLLVLLETKKPNAWVHRWAGKRQCNVLHHDFYRAI